MKTAWMLSGISKHCHETYFFQRVLSNTWNTTSIGKIKINTSKRRKKSQVLIFNLIREISILSLQILKENIQPTLCVT